MFSSHPSTRRTPILDILKTRHPGRPPPSRLGVVLVQVCRYITLCDSGETQRLIDTPIVKQAFGVQAN